MTNKQKAAKVKEFKKKGLSTREACKRVGIKENSYYSALYAMKGKKKKPELVTFTVPDKSGGISLRGLITILQMIEGS